MATHLLSSSSGPEAGIPDGASACRQNHHGSVRHSQGGGGVLEDGLGEWALALADPFPQPDMRTLVGRLG